MSDRYVLWCDNAGQEGWHREVETSRPPIEINSSDRQANEERRTAILRRLRREIESFRLRNSPFLAVDPEMAEHGAQEALDAHLAAHLLTKLEEPF